MGLSHVYVPRKMEQGLSSQGRQLPGWPAASQSSGLSVLGYRGSVFSWPKKETVLEISLDEEVKKKLVSTQAKPVLLFI